jgi:hypothetical protein
MYYRNTQRRREGRKNQTRKTRKEAVDAFKNLHRCGGIRQQSEDEELDFIIDEACDPGETRASGSTDPQPQLFASQPQETITRTGNDYDAERMGQNTDEEDLSTNIIEEEKDEELKHTRPIDGHRDRATTRPL